MSAESGGVRELAGADASRTFAVPRESSEIAPPTEAADHARYASTPTAPPVAASSLHTDHADRSARGERPGPGGRPDPSERALERFHDLTRRRGVNRVVYWLTRIVLQPLIHAYFRLERIGHEHIPDGPVILASNHRSFLDPFVIGCCLRRPIYFVAKRELFERRFWGRYLNWLGAFPVRRGESDEEAMATALALLERGEAVVIFPEGTRIRHGSLGRPRRGVGRLALESGAPVVPIAVSGTERARRGLIIRPVKVRVRCGAPLRFPRVDRPSPSLAEAVLERVWPHVQVQWEWLGGDPPLRRAVCVGEGATCDALAAALERAGVAVTRVAATAADDRRHGGGAESDGFAQPDRCAQTDLVVLAVGADELPSAVARIRPLIGERTAVLVAANGLVGPTGATPAAYVAEQLRSGSVVAIGGAALADDELDVAAIARGEGCAVVAATDPAARARVAQALRAGGLGVDETTDVIGLELAVCAQSAAAAAAEAAASESVTLAGVAVGRVFEEVEHLARRLGARPSTLLGPAGAGQVVSAVLARLERRGTATAKPLRVRTSLHEARRLVALLEQRMGEAGVDAPFIRSLRAHLEGRLDHKRWLERVRRPRPTQRPA